MIEVKQFEHKKPSGLDYLCEATATAQGRLYSTPEGAFPSVSTITSLLNEDAIAEWKKNVGEEEANKIGATAARRGTDVHWACEQYLLNKLSRLQMISLMPSTKELFLQLLPYLNKYISDVYCVEQALYSSTLKTAGKTDGAVLWDLTPSIIDYKTSRKFKQESYLLHYFLQCTMYALMFKERTGIAIEQFVVIIAVEGEQHPQIVKKPIHPYIPQVQPLIDKYYARYSSLA